MMFRILFSIFIFCAVVLGYIHGANAQTYIKGPALIEGVTTITSSGSTTGLTNLSQTVQAVIGTNTHTIQLADATTIPAGKYFYITNRSTLNVTITNGAGGALATLIPNTQGYVVLRVAGSVAGTWDVSNIKIDLASALNVQGILPIANGGTNSSTALSNNRVMISSAGAIVENTALTASAPVRTNASGTLTTGATSLTTEVSGVLPIANGGTNASTASTAFNNLSPMTTGGDLIYGGVGGVGTRLPNGTAGQVLTSQGGTLAPVWATNAPASFIAKGYIEKTSVGPLNMSASAIYSEITSPDLQLTPVAGSAPMGITCNLANAATTPSTSPTVCAGGTESMGFAVTLPYVGWYEICVAHQLAVASGAGGAGGINTNIFQTPPSSQVQIQRSYDFANSYTNTTNINQNTPMNYCTKMYFASTGLTALRLFALVYVTPPGTVGIYMDAPDRFVVFSMDYLHP